MMLTDDVELLDGLPIAYIRSINTLAVADLHLGYEGVMSGGAALLPKVNLSNIIKDISAAIKMTRATAVIVDGDIKNEFSKVDREEFNELYDFIQFVRSAHISLILIKGNHDNFVERYKEPFKLDVYRQEANIGGYLFFHGEELPKDMTKSIKMLIMGHEHPAIGIYNQVGFKEKLKCFLYGKYMGMPLLILPAMNYFAGGTEINNEPRNSLLSPVFRRINPDNMNAIAIGYGSTMDFGKVGKLRSLKA